MSQVNSTLLNSPTFGRDAFGRLQVSEVSTLFDSKLLHDKMPLFWDETVTNNSGNATSTSNVNQAAVACYVEATDTIVRQTYQRFGYQPGKSQLVLMTGILGAGGTGVKARIGQFDASDGLFFELDNDTVYVVIRKAGSDTRVAQSSWNQDAFLGAGPSNRVLDTTKAQIFAITYEWLGVGKVTFGLGVDGVIVPCHSVDHANSVTSVYMATPDNPLRYEISSAAQGDSSTLTHICSTVISEGGFQPSGVIRSGSIGVAAASAIQAAAINTKYAICGIRLKSTRLDAVVEPLGISVIETTAATTNYQWSLHLDPTGVSLTYADLTNSALQFGTGSAADPGDALTGDGTIIAQGYVAGGSRSITEAIQSTLRLGSKIDGTPQELVLAVTAFATNKDFYGGLTWREQL